MTQKIYLHQVDSTSDFLRLHRDEYGDFSFVYADIQTKGHGRLGRTWLSAPKENLTFSFILKDKEVLSLGSRITLLVASIVARCIEGLGLLPKIKWPNDIYIHHKKAVGILLEGSLPDYVIVGVGINVNQLIFEGEYRTSPTSLALELGKLIDIDTFRERLFDALEAGFKHPLEAYQDALSYYGCHDYLLGKIVALEGSGQYEVMGVDAGFQLLLKEACSNEVLHNASGEITVLKKE